MTDKASPLVRLRSKKKSFKIFPKQRPVFLYATRYILLWQCGRYRRTVILSVFTVLTFLHACNDLSLREKPLTSRRCSDDSLKPGEYGRIYFMFMSQLYPHHKEFHIHNWSMIVSLFNGDIRSNKKESG